MRRILRRSVGTYFGVIRSSHEAYLHVIQPDLTFGAHCFSLTLPDLFKREELSPIAVGAIRLILWQR